jgi:hypothetical protein
MALRLSAVRSEGALYSPQNFLVLISVIGRVDPRAILRLEGLLELENLMTSSGIEPATFRLVAWCLSQLRYRVPSQDTNINWKFWLRKIRKILLIFKLKTQRNSLDGTKMWSYHWNRPSRPIWMWNVEAPTFSRQSAHRCRWSCQPYAPAALLLLGRVLVLISVRGWVDPRTIVRLEGDKISLKIQWPQSLCRSQWPRGLRHELSSLARTRGSWVRIQFKAWMSVWVYSMFVLFCM